MISGVYLTVRTPNFYKLWSRHRRLGRLDFLTKIPIYRLRLTVKWGLTKSSYGVRSTMTVPGEVRVVKQVHAR